jgi:hypothetical protein
MITAPSVLLRGIRRLFSGDPPSWHLPNPHSMHQHYHVPPAIFVITDEGDDAVRFETGRPLVRVEVWSNQTLIGSSVRVCGSAETESAHISALCPVHHDLLPTVGSCVVKSCVCARTVLVVCRAARGAKNSRPSARGIDDEHDEHDVSWRFCLKRHCRAARREWRFVGVPHVHVCQPAELCQVPRCVCHHSAKFSFRTLLRHSICDLQLIHFGDMPRTRHLVSLPAPTPFALQCAKPSRRRPQGVRLRRGRLRYCMNSKRCAFA